MRSIDISTDVFAAIWANRRPGEDSENDILRRILNYSVSAPDAQPFGGASDDCRGNKRYIEGSVMGRRVTWADDLVAVLEGCGGKAHLSYIYDAVAKLRRANGRSVPKTLDAVVRRTLEDHCLESENYREIRNLFSMPEGKGAGIWALR